MYKRCLMASLLGLVFTQTLISSCYADALEIVVPTKAGVSPPDAIAVIKVDGASPDGPYDSVVSKTIDYIVAVRGDLHKKSVGSTSFGVKIEADSGSKDGNASGTLSKQWKYYKVSRPYRDPRSSQIENATVSPVALCNEKLKATSGNQRKEFLKKGTLFSLPKAYELLGHAKVEITKWPGFEVKTYYEKTRAPVTISCMNLDRPRVRKNSTTTGADAQPPAKKMQPTISEVGLRIEPSQIQQMGKFLCPTQLRLYGRLETIREFTGKSIFVGPYYLSPVTEIKMTKAGNRNMVGAYAMKWQQMGGLTTAPNAEPKKQTLSFKFNVSNMDGKVLESLEKSVQVSCKKIKVNAPLAGNGEMTVAPAD